MLLLGEGSEATEPYNKDDKIRPHSIRSLQFDQKVRPLSFRPEKFDLFTATRSNLAMEFFLLSNIMDLRHQSTAMCHHVGGKDTPRDQQRKEICTSHYPSERVETKNSHQPQSQSTGKNKFFRKLR